LDSFGTHSAAIDRNEAAAKKALSVSRWYGDESWHDSLVRLVSQPTIYIEGLVGGYTGPGGKTILPHRAVAKIGRLPARNQYGRGLPPSRDRSSVVAEAGGIVARRDFHGATAALAAGQFGLGHGASAHAPDEYCLIESANPEVAGMDGAVRSYVDLFYALA
jgi:hypothetical protein